MRLKILLYALTVEHFISVSLFYIEEHFNYHFSILIYSNRLRLSPLASAEVPGTEPPCTHRVFDVVFAS